MKAWRLRIVQLLEKGLVKGEGKWAIRFSFEPKCSRFPQLGGSRALLLCKGQFHINHLPGAFKGPPAVVASPGHMLAVPCRIGDVETEVGAHIFFGFNRYFPTLVVLGNR